MVLAAHTIYAAKGSRHKTKRLGRGNASGKGTMSGRGGKGQRARTGGKSGTERRGFKQSLQKIPKLRGFKSIYPRMEIVTLGTLERLASEDKVITPSFLKEKSVISRPQNGVKILATGSITKKVIVSGCVASKSAAEAIEKAGGSLTF